MNTYVKSVLEGDPALANIAIKGEISNFNRNYKSGHCYFSLKDEKSSVKAVMFRSAADRLSFQPENGMGVIARCRVSLYERDGAFQIYVDDLFPDGVGAMQMAFEQMKERLGKEGLFAQEHKKMIPAHPKTIGLITSKTGAALQDILKVAERRCPTAHFVLFPVTVQGLDAAPQIAAAIRTMDQSGLVDVMIVARGGGSAEDLWVFNSEDIARAVFACKTPVISAIGHEIDFTILDFVADQRAPTPSAAAEMALPDLALLYSSMVFLYTNIGNTIQKKLNSCYNTYKVNCEHTAISKVKAMPEKNKQLWLNYAQELQKKTYDKLNQREKQLGGAAALAHGLNPYAVLARGYGVVSNQTGVVVNSVKNIQLGDQLNVELRDGVLACLVEAVQDKKERELK